MKSTSRLNVRIAFEDKSEILGLQRENSNLRNQLKLFGNRISDLIQIKDAKSTKKLVIYSNPEEELREAKKLIEIYKKEKKFLSQKLKKTLDLHYYPELASTVEKNLQILNNYENQKKNNELWGKKENLYRQTPVKMFDTAAEINYLNKKKFYYVEKIQEIEQDLEKSKKGIRENSKKLEDLEKEHKELMEELGEPYFHELSQKKFLDNMKKKKQIEQIIVKETHSKINVMQQKIRALQGELKVLKENEAEKYNQMQSVSKQVEINSQRIRKSPIFMNKQNVFDNRSRSVKPKYHFPIDISYN